MTGISAEPCRCGGKGRRKRSAEEDREEKQLLATLIKEQDNMYNSNNLRAQRAALPPTERNIIFAVDSSGSIKDDYPRVLQILGTFSRLFCGYISVGMVTFGTHIELELCPTCLRNLGETEYREEVYNRITAARYHGDLTSTGEAVKCLADHILPSPDCRVLNKPTQVVFFTDGRPNGCLDSKKQMEALVSKYPRLETYVIAMGPDILASGVADLQGGITDPANFFSVQNITVLEDLMNKILTQIFTGNLACAPHEV